MPPSKSSDARDAIELSAGYGLRPDPWQELVLEDWLALDKFGKYASNKCGLAVPRQNGKNALIEMRELFGLVVLGEKFLHTAHEVKTARKAFVRLCSFFENERDYPELARLVSSIRKTNGQEAIVLKSGASVEFVARTGGSARGFTVDVVVMDECQHLQDEHLEALMPTTSSAPLGNPQWIMTGTPPGPGQHGEAFTRSRTNTIEQAGGRSSWHEWSPVLGADLDDRSIWAATNPALGGRMSWESVEQLRATLSDEGFFREALGGWSGAAGNAVVSPEVWATLALERPKVPRQVAVAVDVDVDQALASVAVAGAFGDDEWLVTLEDQRPGIAWLPDHLENLTHTRDVVSLVVDGRTAAATWLVDELKKRRVTVTTPSVREVSSAFNLFVSLVNDGLLHHPNRHELTNSVLGGRKRVLGGQSSWNPANDAVDITAARSVTLALWGAHTSTVKRPKRGERRKVVVM